MKESATGGYQVLSDGRTVWVNEATGSAVARVSCFGDLVMIDVHRPLAQQCDQGECLDCRHDLTNAAAWEYFVASVRRHFGLQIPATHRPRWAR